MGIEFSIIIPVYKNVASIPLLIQELNALNSQLPGELETVFVVDGCPQGSYMALKGALPSATFSSQLILHSRNFGSFAAIRAGLVAATGDYSVVMAADLQEPPSFALEMLISLKNDPVDVIVGHRADRKDPFLTTIASNTFWYLYRKLVIKDIPKGGVDIFACNRQFRTTLIQLEEQHTSLIGLIYWLGFRRSEMSYSRKERQHGKSAWTLSKKINYLMDSIFAFSDLPIKILFSIGLIGISASALLAIIILSAKIFGEIDVPGYAATLITITFFGAFNSLGLGIIGAYVWRAYGNTQRRPVSLVQSIEKFSFQKGSNND